MPDRCHLPVVGEVEGRDEQRRDRQRTADPQRPRRARRRDDGGRTRRHHVRRPHVQKMPRRRRELASSDPEGEHALGHECARHMSDRSGRDRQDRPAHDLQGAEAEQGRDDPPADRVAGPDR